MMETLSGKATRAVRAVAVAAVAVFGPLFLAWGVAVICHLYCLRRGLDVCCVDD